MPKLKIVCAWCNKELGEKEGPEGITHGICDDCLLRYFPHHYEKIKDTLEVGNIEEIYKKGGSNCGQKSEVRQVPD